MEEKYPTLKVILIYSLFGGFVGGAFLGLFMAIGLNPFNTSHYLNKPTSGISETLNDIQATAFFGIFFGFLPAFITGIILAIGKIIPKNYKDYLTILGIGFLTTMFLYAQIPTINDFKNFENLLDKIILSSCGGFSSLLLGFVALPYHQKENEK